MTLGRTLSRASSDWSGAISDTDAAAVLFILRKVAEIQRVLIIQGWARDGVAVAGLAMMTDDLANAAADLRANHRPG